MSSKGKYIIVTDRDDDYIFKKNQVAHDVPWQRCVEFLGLDWEDFQIVTIRGKTSVKKTIKPYLKTARGILLAGKRASKLIESVTPADPWVCFNQVYRYRGVPVVIGYSAYDLELNPGNSFLYGQNVRSLHYMVEGKAPKISNEPFKLLEVQSLADWKAAYREIRQAKEVSIDTETRNLNRLDNKLLSAQFGVIDSHGEELAIVVLMDHPDSKLTRKAKRIIRRDLKRFFEENTAVHIYVRAQFDLVQLRRDIGYAFYKANLWDIQTAEYIWRDENRKFRKSVYHDSKTFALEQMAIEYGYLGYAQKAAVGKEDRANLESVSGKDLAEYGAKDVIVPLRIYKLQRKLIPEKHQLVVLHQFSDILHAFAVMEYNGLKVDVEYLMRAVGDNAQLREIIDKETAFILSSKEGKKAATLLSKFGHANLFSTPVAVLDLNKPDHAQALFVDVMGLEAVGGHRKDGRPKLNKTWKEYHKGNPLVAAYLRMGEAKKLHSTYLVGFLEKATTDDDMKIDFRLRPQFELIIIVTSRASARTPALHQIPSRSPLAKVIKRQFVVDRGEIFVEFDYNAQEVLIAGVTADDHDLCGSFRVNLEAKAEYRLLPQAPSTEKEKAYWELKFKRADIHNRNASLYFGVQDPANVDKKTQRDPSKTVTFGIFYDLHYTTLAKRLGFVKHDSTDEEIEEGNAKALDLIEKMFTALPRVKEFMDETHDTAERELEVTNLIGQPRHLWAFLSANPYNHTKASRKGPNSVIQSVASHCGFTGIRKYAEIAWELFKDRWPGHVDNAVHDSQYSGVKIELLPAHLYMVEHASIHQMAAKYRDIYGVKWPVIPGMGIAFGGSLATTEEWDLRYDSIRGIVEKTIEWQNSEMGFNYSKSEIRKMLSALDHNTDIVWNLRRKELETHKAYRIHKMLATPENMKNIRGLL